MLKERFISTQVKSVYCQTSGDPVNLLVLGIHGLSQRNGWHTWEPILEPLGNAGFFAVSVDMPGWGQSPAWDNNPHSNESAVKSVLEIVASLDKKKVNLMGKSWGGGVAINVALKHPELVSSLILSAPAFRELEKLRDLDLPTLIVWAKDDAVIPVTFAEQFNSRIRRSQLVLYDTGGHGVASANADDFGLRVVEFLRSLGGNG